MAGAGSGAERAGYDRIADDYAAFVAAGLADPTSVLRLATDALLARVGDVRGKTVCDLGCGEGHLARALAARGAVAVGVDRSAPLLAMARGSAGPGGARVVRDDAQRLASFRDRRFDVVASTLALMDIPDLAAVYAAVRRVLRPGDRFLFSVTHPCFQGPGADTEVDADGAFVARRVTQYAMEGFWRSDHRAGVRGRVGAHHRTLATYLNRLVDTGFAVAAVVEPTLAPARYDDPYARGRIEFPPVLVVDALRS